MKTIRILFILICIIVCSTAALAAKKTLTLYTWDSSINALPTGAGLPKANIAVLSVSFDSLLSNLNTAGTNVGAVTYVDSSNCTSVWATFKNYTLINDPENSSCRIGALTVPLKTASCRRDGSRLPHPAMERARPISR